MQQSIKIDLNRIYGKTGQTINNNHWQNVQPGVICK